MLNITAIVILEKLVDYIKLNIIKGDSDSFNNLLYFYKIPKFAPDVLFYLKLNMFQSQCE